MERERHRPQAAADPVAAAPAFGGCSGSVGPGPLAAWLAAQPYTSPYRPAFVDEAAKPSGPPRPSSPRYDGQPFGINGLAAWRETQSLGESLGHASGRRLPGWGPHRTVVKDDASVLASAGLPREAAAAGACRTSESFVNSFATEQFGSSGSFGAACGSAARLPGRCGTPRASSPTAFDHCAAAGTPAREGPPGTVRTARRSSSHTGVGEQAGWTPGGSAWETLERRTVALQEHRERDLLELERRRKELEEAVASRTRAIAVAERAADVPCHRRSHEELRRCAEALAERLARAETRLEEQSVAQAAGDVLLGGPRRTELTAAPRPRASWDRGGERDAEGWKARFEQLGAERRRAEAKLERDLAAVRGSIFLAPQGRS
eukprot:SRR837773.15601.p1 GENE.SRR837773.15601~~SRR837773.15601.p1  ORF type:complete len:417 (+),score=14.36 SRR837773.15601:122-1252(+)